VLTTDDFAWMALASTAGWMLSVATDFGLQLHLAKEVARMPDAPGRALWPLLKRKRQLLAAGFFAAVVLPFVWLDARVAVPFAGIALAFLLSSLVEFLNYAYRGLNRSDLESSINLMQRLGGVAFAWVLLTWWPSLLTVAIALLVPPMITSAISLTVLTRMAPSTPDARANPPAICSGAWRRSAPASFCQRCTFDSTSFCCNTGRAQPPSLSTARSFD
jgi:hypothetical protein